MGWGGFGSLVGAQTADLAQGGKCGIEETKIGAEFGGGGG